MLWWLPNWQKAKDSKNFPQLLFRKIWKLPSDFTANQSKCFGLFDSELQTVIVVAWMFKREEKGIIRVFFFFVWHRMSLQKFMPIYTSKDFQVNKQRPCRNISVFFQVTTMSNISVCSIISIFFNFGLISLPYSDQLMKLW